MLEDSQLLAQYAASRSEAAFAELVRRRLNLVYSVALRWTHGDVHCARDAAQAVFIDLARKAHSLSKRPALLGWLCRSAQFAASDLIRERRRRGVRDQKALQLNNLELIPPAEPDWNEVRPELDNALAKLSERDRNAVLLRFFDNRPFAEIGEQLQLTENAARMRVERALEKLRAALARRGVQSTATAVGVGLGSQAAHAAPTGMAAVITAAAIEQSAAAAAGLAALFTMTTLKSSVVGVFLVAATATAFVLARDHEVDPTPAPAAPIAVPAQQAVVPAPRKTDPSLKVARPTRSDYANWTAMANDPQLLRRTYNKEKKKVDLRYAPFFQQQKLSPADTDRLTKILIAMREAPADVFVAAIQKGIDPEENAGELMREAHDARIRLDAEISDLLGPDGYSQYLDYFDIQHLAGQADVFNRMQASLSASGDTMSADQVAKLQQLLHGGGHVSAEVIDEAADFLTPAQQKALATIREAQLANELQRQRGETAPN